MPLKRSQLKVDYFLRGYLDCALFTTDENPPYGQDYVESGRAAEMYSALPAEFIEQAKADCLRFQQANGALLESAFEYDGEIAGHSFWYSRNGHGTGFFDRDDEYPDGVADKLQDAAEAFGEHNLDLEPEETTHE